MSLNRLDFEEISEADLQSLIDAGVPEGLQIDYKADLYGRSDRDRKEFLKDVSSFANTTGGHLVIGMTEHGGVAMAIAPLMHADADAEVSRLENLMREGIQPRISGARVKTVGIAAGGFVIVVRIPRSWNSPHRVSAQNSNRFFVRNSAGVHEASIEELRVLFNLAASAQERMRAFRRDRIAAVTAGNAPAQLTYGGGLLLLHIVPFAAFSALEPIEIQRAMELSSGLMPIGASGHTPRYNFDGVICTRGGSLCHGYTQLFRNGCIESAKVGILREKSLPSTSFEKGILEAMPRYLEVLRKLDVPPPLVLMLTLEGMQGAALAARQHAWDDDAPQPFDRPVLDLPEAVIDDYGSAHDYQRAVRPALDALWNAAGYANARNFDENGVWSPPS